ncbi:MAG TPA: imidazole glycerol phosphate synthase subunit HisH [Gemmatimonadaceae bacterium]|nr:imidazole glycerol phosphate synthase subunit HisH [Gemmatimonadaceae bacterium]
MRVTLFDYGAGNLHSLAKALDVPGVTLRVESDPRLALDTDALVLPGVGAFAQAAERLAPAREAVRDALRGGLPCLGICLGMQLLFDASEEGAEVPGLGVIPGQVTRLRARRVPQIGWNQLEDVSAADPLFARAPLDVAYFANSYACRPAADARATVTAWATHEGDTFAAAVRAGSTVGVQFHPEKSSSAGVRFVRAWVDEAGRGSGVAALARQERHSDSPDRRPPTPEPLRSHRTESP